MSDRTGSGSAAAESATHRLLARQLRHLNLDATASPTSEAWASLLSKVSTAYEDFDRHKYLAERTLELSNKEMSELHYQLDTARQRQRAVFDRADVGMFVLDTNGIIEAANPTAARMLGMTERALLGRVLWDAVEVRASGEVGAVLDAYAFERVMTSREPWACEDGIVSATLWAFLERRGNDESVVTDSIRGVHASCVITPMHLDDVPTGAVLVTRDTSALRTAVNDLAWQASHDSLTGLPNRDGLGDLLRRTIRGDSPVWVLYLDLDRFKYVNDSLGHAAGDELLVRVADRMRSVVRPFDIVARISGDEFVIICAGPGEQHDILQIARRLITTIDQPFDINGQEVMVSASIGAARSRPGEAPEEVLREADQAMYRAKQDGRNCVRVFNDLLRATNDERSRAETVLRRLLRQGGLQTVLQPQVELLSGATRGYEILSRWPDTEKPILNPGEFIPLAEEVGLVGDIGTFVLLDACYTLSEWAASMRGLSISVNVSGSELTRRDFAARFLHTLTDYYLRPAQLTIEVTERVLVTDRGAIDQLHVLRDAGVGVSVDDFGTGYSSLANLRRLPVSELKIDRAFVEPLGRSKADFAVVSAIVELGHALDLTIVAEGVETPEQRDALIAAECDWAQGYFFGRPAPRETWVRDESGAAVSQA